MFTKIFFTGLVFSAILSLPGISAAGLDAPTKQVMIEAKIVECTNEFSRALFTKNETDGVTTEIGFLYKECGPSSNTEAAPNAASSGQTFLEVSILSRGTGSGGRDWVPERPILKIGKEQVRPVTQEKFYADRESVAQNAAGIIFAAIGGRYADVGRTAGASEGKVCPVTGQKLEGADERSGLQKGIDRAGTAAGLGLLASQAKGQITGLRATFNITDKIEMVLVPDTSTLLQANLRNTSSDKNILLSNIPILGSLFRSRTEEQNKKEALIMITPQLINNGDEGM